MKLKLFVAALGAGSALMFAPMAVAAPNQHAVDSANEHAQTGGLSVAAAAGGGGGPADVLAAVAASAPDAAQKGLARAQCVAADLCEP